MHSRVLPRISECLHAAVNSRVLARIREYFHATPDRQSRFLEFDITAEDSGRQLCYFVFPGDDTRCASLTTVPEVQVYDLPDEMLQEARQEMNRATRGRATST